MCFQSSHNIFIIYKNWFWLFIKFYLQTISISKIIFCLLSSVNKELGSSELALQSASVSISNSGEMGWLKKLLTTTTCKMNFNEFPYDEQVCTLELVSWSYDNSSIHLVPIPRNDVIRQDDTWNVTKIETSVVYEDADCCKYPFPYIIIKVCNISLIVDLKIYKLMKLLTPLF